MNRRAQVDAACLSSFQETDMSKSKTSLAIVFALGLSAPLAALAQDIVAWRSPSCGCCRLWVKHLEDAGMKVTMIDVRDIAKIKKEHGITPELASCHTAIVEGYTIEGHVPASEIKRLLAERPDAIGLSVPGMPAGSPGMEQGAAASYNVLLVKRDGSTEVFAHYP
nr:Predicted metal-binding protein [Methylocystis sp. SC2]